MKKAVLISCFDWYKARLEPIRELLIKREYDVMVLEADFDHIKKSSIGNRFPECTYIHVVPYKNNLSLDRIRSHLSFGKQVGKVLDQIKPDLVYCLIPPNNLGNVCRKYKEQHPETELILDIIDLWPESMPLGKMKQTPIAVLWKKWRDDAIIIADNVFTECDLYQEKLKGILNPEKTKTLYLFKERSEEERALVETIIRKEKIDDIIRFAYLGSMNNIIDIEGICGVLKQFIDGGKKCELHAIGAGESRKEFEDAVRETGCTAYFYGAVFDELKKITILASCDYAFNMMKGDISVGLTIKSIDYMSYGLPLINNIKGDTWKLVEDCGIGMNVDVKNRFNYKQIDNRSHLRTNELFMGKFSLETFRKTVEEILYRD